jgi:hypothetical protein
VSPYEQPKFAIKLAELAGLFHRKRPDEAAMLIWFRHLQVFPIELIIDVLDAWPGTEDVFPTVAALRSACQRRAANLRWADMQSAAALPPPLPDTPQPNARAFIAMQADLRAGKASSPREWCERAAGGANPEHRHFAEAALRGMGTRPEREPLPQVPGFTRMDAAAGFESAEQREARLEREAIQAEAVMS